MTAKNFTTAFTVAQSADEAFAAINNPRGWWSEEIEGDTDKVGAVFRYRYGDMHRCVIEIAELARGRRVVWRVRENYFDFTADKSEWTGTTIIFDITAKGAKTEIRFTHDGLTPAYECFDLCAGAWRDIMRESLRALIETGRGRAPPKARAATSDRA